MLSNVNVRTCASSMRSRAGREGGSCETPTRARYASRSSRSICQGCPVIARAILRRAVWRAAPGLDFSGRAVSVLAKRGPGLLGRCVNGFVTGDAVTRSQDHQQSNWFRRVWRHERGVHRVHRDERDITSVQLSAFFSNPLLDGSAAKQDDFLLIRVSVEVVPLAGLDLHVEHAQPGALRHVGGPHDPTKIAPVEFFPLDIIDTDETHGFLLLLRLTAWTGCIAPYSLKTHVGSGCTPERTAMAAAAGPTQISR